MGNVLMCYQQNRRLSIIDETTMTNRIELESSSDEEAVPHIGFIPLRSERKSALDISQIPSGDMANLIIQADSSAFYACEGNIFNNSNKTIAGLTPISTRSPLGRYTWRDTETFTQHEKWLRTCSPSLILPTLFLGSKKDSLMEERLKELQITHILSLMGGKQHLVSGCKHLHVPMADSGNTCLDEVMNRSFGFIKESQQDGNKILIHCLLGQNRSPTVVIAWLMTESPIGTPMSMHDAYLFVKKKRDIVHPSNLYIQQLREYDKHLFGVYSVKPNFLSVSYEDGELKVQHENWTADQSDKYKELQKTESSESFKSHIESRGVSLDNSQRSVKTSKIKGTYGISLMLPVTPRKDSGTGNIYRKPQKPVDIERFSEDHSVISLEGKKE